MTKIRELEIPSGVMECEEAGEFVRFWIADGQDHITLHIGAMGDAEVHQWGMILADISDHIIHALRHNGDTRAVKDIRAEIERSYLERLAVKDRDFSGSLIGSKQ
jgi:hypothetical protein